ncbi:YihY/virulence factor BrkB family protein [Methylobacterium fujisawaense]
MAAGVAFWRALALFPAVALIAWLAHHLLGIADVGDILRTVTDVMPDSVGDIIAWAIRAASDANPADSAADLGWPVGPAFGLLLSLWSVTVAMQALFHALDQTFEAEKRRSWLRLTAVSLAFTLGALIVMACALAATVALSQVLSLVDGALPGTLLRWVTVFVTFLLTVTILYRVGSSRDREGWPFITLGGVVAAVTLVVECSLFSWTVGHFATLEITYGLLSTAAAFLLRLWVSVAIVLAGGGTRHVTPSRVRSVRRPERKGRDEPDYSIGVSNASALLGCGASCLRLLYARAIEPELLGKG